MDELWAYTNSQDSAQPELGKSTTFLFIIFYVTNHGDYTQMSFSRDFQIESPEIPEIRIHAILEAYNFLCKCSIEVRFQPNL
jgi:hypothetical protein